MDTGSLFTYSLLHKTQGSSCWRAQCTGRHRTGSNIGVRLSCCKQACGTLQCLTSHCSIAGRRHSSLSAPCQHHPHRREWHWWHQNLMPNMFKAWNQDGQWHSFWVPLCHFIRPALQQRIYRCDVCRVQLIVRIVQCYESRTIPWKRFHQKKLRKNKERKFERRIKTELIHERCDGAPHAPLIRLRSFGQKKLIGFLQAKSFFFFLSSMEALANLRNVGESYLRWPPLQSPVKYCNCIYRFYCLHCLKRKPRFNILDPPFSTIADESFLLQSGNFKSQCRTGSRNQHASSYSPYITGFLTLVKSGRALSILKCVQLQSTARDHGAPTRPRAS